jgi:phosphatidate phosphatase PAH1
MKGFFEHQYLSYKKNHVKNLLALANIDGFMHEKEIELLFKIGKRLGLKTRQVQELINSEEKFQMVVPDNHNDRMNLLYDLLLMVHADEVINQHEVKFCEDAAEQFHLKKEIIPWLLKVFEKGAPVFHEEWEEIKGKAKEEFVLN